MFGWKVYFPLKKNSYYNESYVQKSHNTIVKNIRFESSLSPRPEINSADLLSKQRKEISSKPAISANVDLGVTVRIIYVQKQGKPVTVKVL